jgi:hypothetical protein
VVVVVVVVVMMLSKKKEDDNDVMLMMLMTMISHDDADASTADEAGLLTRQPDKLLIETDFMPRKTYEAHAYMLADLPSGPYAKKVTIGWIGPAYGYSSAILGAKSSRSGRPEVGPLHQEAARWPRPQRPASPHLVTAVTAGVTAVRACVCRQFMDYPVWTLDREYQDNTEVRRSVG